MSYPTPETVVASAPLKGGRLSIIWDEVVKIQSSILPGVVKITNEDKPLDLASPQAYYVKGEQINSKFPAMVVEASTNYETFGHAFLGETSLKIHIISAASKDRVKMSDLADLADLSKDVMGQFLSRHCDEEGRDCWTQLTFVSNTELAGEDWKNYIGRTISYRVTQAPGVRRW